MKTKNNQTAHNTRIVVVISAFIVLATSTLAFARSPRQGVHFAAPEMSGSEMPMCDVTCDTASGSAEDIRTAEILQQRLRASGGIIPGLRTLTQAVQGRRDLLQRSVFVTVSDALQPSAPSASFTIDLFMHPELIVFRNAWSTAAYEVSEALLADALAARKFGDMRVLTSVTIASTSFDGKVTRADNIPVARDGYDYDYDALAHIIARAFANDETSLNIDLGYEKAFVQIRTASGSFQSLQLLGSGLSNYTGSPENRIWNVHKSINERLNNVIVKPGQIFSFVDTLGGPVTLDKGWVNGLGLFGGGAAMTPGAGICQAATTMFRAGLLAGLPIVEKRNHSLWVDHYEPYGAGLDATIFPGVHDLRFRNDTPGTILIQAYIVGDDVTVNLYGIDDARTVVMDGPYFYATPHRASELRPLSRDEIGWVQHVTYANGKQIDKPLIATYYKGIPRFVTLKYAGLPGETIMHELVPDIKK